MLLSEQESQREARNETRFCQFSFPIYFHVSKYSSSGGGGGGGGMHCMPTLLRFLTRKKETK